MSKTVKYSEAAENIIREYDGSVKTLELNVTGIADNRVKAIKCIRPEMYDMIPNKDDLRDDIILVVDLYDGSVKRLSINLAADNPDYPKAIQAIHKSCRTHKPVKFNKFDSLPQCLKDCQGHEFAYYAELSEKTGTFTDFSKITPVGMGIGGSSAGLTKPAKAVSTIVLSQEIVDIVSKVGVVFTATQLVALRKEVNDYLDSKLK